MYNVLRGISRLFTNLRGNIQDFPKSGSRVFGSIYKEPRGVQKFFLENEMLTGPLSFSGEEEFSSYSIVQ